jgi:hypothetical protein
VFGELGVVQLGGRSVHQTAWAVQDAGQHELWALLHAFAWSMFSGSRPRQARSQHSKQTNSSSCFFF